MAGRSLILCAEGGNNVVTFTTNSASWFWSPVQSPLNATASVAEAQLAVTMRKAATVRNARVRVITNTRATACTVRSRKNGVNGNLLITIDAGLTGTFEDVTNSDTIADGDTYCFTLATSTGGGSLTVKFLVAELQSASGNAHNYLGSGNSPFSSATASTTTFFPYVGDFVGTTTDSDNTSRLPVPCAGVMSRLQVAVSANARTTDTVFRSRVNGANGAQSVTVPAATTGVFEDVTNSDTVAEGDLLGWSVTTGTGTGTITVRRVSIMFVGTADETPYMSATTDTAIATGTLYGSMSGDTEVSATEADVQVPVSFACTLRRFTARLNFGTGGGTIRSRINGANGNGLVTTASSGSQTVADTSNTDVIAANDLVNLSVTTTNTSNANFQGLAILDDIGPGSSAVGVRATQVGGYVGVQTISEGVRATQVGGYVGVQTISEGVRATQVGGYLGRQAQVPIRATQVGGYVGVRMLRPGCLTNEAQCWRIERLDGTVFTFTAHDKPVVFRGETYIPCGSLQSSALETSAEFGATENMDLSGVIASGQITLRDLMSGLFDGATVEVWRVDWNDPTVADLLAAGQCGSLQAGTQDFTFEITTVSQRLQQRPILQPYTPTCRFKLGDTRCGLNLEALRVTGAVTAIAEKNVHTGGRRRLFTDTSRGEAVNYFQLGRLTWTSGENTGISVDVKIHGAGGVFTLELPMEYDIQLGDAYSLVPGCDRLFTTCGTKFNNTINFGGFPHVKGSDDLQKTPGFKQ